ncbi:SNF2-related protein [Clostridium sp.]|uniref:SNF2-related protein n=1 Tax=Clostridium sp. TaxID=1506 RepID=UPI002852CB4B|nr:SNF2-related protein [Clostridium sp.]
MLLRRLCGKFPVLSQRNCAYYDGYILIDANTSKIEETHCECLDYKNILEAFNNINVKSKFVLTGTPIENNLIQLWSIFDFIMPN